MIWVCKTILSDGLDKCYFLQKNVEVLITPTIILEPLFLISKEENMNNIDLMNYWIKSSDEDYDTMQVMYKTKRIHGLYF